MLPPVAEFTKTLNFLPGLCSQAVGAGSVVRTGKGRARLCFSACFGFVISSFTLLVAVQLLSSRCEILRCSAPLALVQWKGFLQKRILWAHEEHSAGVCTDVPLQWCCSISRGAGCRPSCKHGVFCPPEAQSHFRTLRAKRRSCAPQEGSCPSGTLLSVSKDK